MNQLSKTCLITLLAFVLNGCSQFSYYQQAITGHLSLMWEAEPIEDMLKSPDVTDAVKQRLQLAQQARSFARDRLALPVGDAFTEYAHFDRPYVVVNLVAVPEFSLTPHHWCYPFVGCQAYRGYYDLDDARAERETFTATGHDTLIAGVTAYSTLGWFDDPLHTGFIRLPESRMVALIFHELAHRVIYLDGDTTFNESFATAVELEGLRLWLTLSGQPEAFDSALERLRHREETAQLIAKTREALEHLYQNTDDLPDADLRAAKAEIFSSLTDQYRRLSEDWQQPGPFGRNPESLNNANIALFSQYNQHVQGFRQLFRDSGNGFKEFYEAVEALSQQPQTERNQKLVELGERFDKNL